MKLSEEREQYRTQGINLHVMRHQPHSNHEMTPINNLSLLYNSTFTLTQGPRQTLYCTATLTPTIITLPITSRPSNLESNPNSQSVYITRQKVHFPLSSLDQTGPSSSSNDQTIAFPATPPAPRSLPSLTLPGTAALTSFYIIFSNVRNKPYFKNISTFD